MFFDWGEGAKRKSHAMTAQKVGFLWDRDAVEWKVSSWDMCMWHKILILLKGGNLQPKL